MKKVDDQIMNAIVALEGNNDWQKVKTWIQESLDEQHEFNDFESASDSVLRTGQGYAKALRKILEEVKAAVDRKRKTTRI